MSYLRKLLRIDDVPKEWIWGLVFITVAFYIYSYTISAWINIYHEEIKADVVAYRIGGPLVVVAFVVLTVGSSTFFIIGGAKLWKAWKR